MLRELSTNRRGIPQRQAWETTPLKRVPSSWSTSIVASTRCNRTGRSDAAATRRRRRAPGTGQPDRDLQRPIQIPSHPLAAAAGRRLTPAAPTASGHRIISASQAVPPRQRPLPARLAESDNRAEGTVVSGSHWRPAPATPAAGVAGTASLGQGVMRRSGPWSSWNWRVLSAWMPAVWSPLNGVVVFGHPAALASFGELNHSPRW